MIFLLIVALIVLVVSSFMLGYDTSEINWWKAMYTTLDDCDRDIDSNHHTTDWYYGVIWAHRSIMENLRSIMENLPSITKNKKGESRNNGH